jgi:hypothetical protein
MPTNSVCNELELVENIDQNKLKNLTQGNTKNKQE